MSQPTIFFAHVDAFTDTLFTGNPAAVCVLSEMPGSEWMQKVAAEMNLSETAFLAQRDGSFDLRWFTPTVEVDLCGHATLASAHVLWEQGIVSLDESIRFNTASGELTATKLGGWIELDFPAEPPEPAEWPANLQAALGAEILFVGRNRLDYVIEVRSEKDVRSLTPGFALLLGAQSRGVIVTARAEMPGVDFVSRCFFPGAGIDEDPVTGSAHCALGPYWSGKLEKQELTAFQASPRGGMLKVGIRGSRVTLKGQAITVVRGEMPVKPGIH